MMTIILLVVAVAGLLALMRKQAGAKPVVVLLAITGVLSLIFASGLLALIQIGRAHV